MAPVNPHYNLIILEIIVFLVGIFVESPVAHDFLYVILRTWTLKPGEKSCGGGLCKFIFGSILAENLVSSTRQTHM